MQNSYTDILFFIAISPTKVGGIELFAHYLAKALDAGNKRITFCFSTPACEEVLGLLNLPNTTVEHLAGQSGFSQTKIRPLWDLIRRIRPSTVVYSFGGILRPLPWISRLAGAKHVLYNDHASRVPQDAESSPIKRLVARAITRPVECVIAVSAFVESSSQSEKMHSGRCVTVPNGVDLCRRGACASREDFLSQHGIPMDRRIVTQISWLVPEKGVDIFLKAAAEILRQRRDVHFVIGGEGSGRQRYEQMSEELGIAGNVTFVGQILDPIASGIYLASDVVCLASRWNEACGLVLLEAMSFGVPVVASRVGGIPEFVRDNVDGLLVTGDHVAFAGAIAALLQDDKRRCSMGAMAKTRVEENFDVRLMAQRYAELLT